MKVSLRCGYGSPQRKSSLSAVRSTFASKTNRNPPLCTVEEERLDLAHPDASSDPCTAKGFSPSSDTSPAAGEPVGGVTSPQGLTAATPLAQSRGTLVLEGADCLSKQIPRAPPTVLTIHFSVDALKLPSVQANEYSPTLPRRIGQEPRAASSNVSRAITTTAIPDERVPTSGTEIAAPAGQVSSRVPYNGNGPSSKEKPPHPHVHAAPIAAAFDAT